MMTHTLTVSPNEFVVRIADPAHREGLMQKLGEWGSVEMLPSYPHLAVLHMEGKAKQQAKRVWQKLQSSFGVSGTIMPVFRDADQQARYPIGTIQVRFKERPSAKDLAALTKAYGFRAYHRNKYAPAQVAFEANDAAERYLPELLQELQDEKDVATAWPETLSAYQRG